MVGVLAANDLGFGLGLSEFCQTFIQRQWAVTRAHGMSKISHTEPFHHCNITQWTHIDEMKWFSSSMVGVLAAKNLSIGLALAEICQTFACGSDKSTWHVQNQPHRASST
jgi:hypothetical protein